MFTEAPIINSSHLFYLNLKILTFLNSIIVFSSVPEICDSNLAILSTLRKEMEYQNTIALVGSVEAYLCEFISQLARTNQKLFVTWNCPQVRYIRSDILFKPRTHLVNVFGQTQANVCIC